MNEFKGSSKYVVSEDLLRIVNISIALQKPLLIKGELDMACVPANLAATLYQKTEGEIVTLGINTLGVLYIVENGNAVRSMADLAGKTIVASGKGSTPEDALNYLLEQNGVKPMDDVIVDWKSEHAECVSALATGAAL